MKAEMANEQAIPTVAMEAIAATQASSLQIIGNDNIGSLLEETVFLLCSSCLLSGQAFLQEDLLFSWIQCFSLPLSKSKNNVMLMLFDTNLNRAVLL
jgi:hypothetical protein